MKLLKKGQVGGLQAFILSIVTVAIVLAVGLLIVSELKTTAKELGTTSALNETVVDGASVSQSGLFISAAACRNVSDPETVFAIGTGCNISSAGVVTGNQSAGISSLRVDYTHYSPSEAYNSTGTIITKLATVPTWIGIIIIVALAFIVLSFFIGRRQ